MLMRDLIIIIMNNHRADMTHKRTERPVYN